MSSVDNRIVNMRFDNRQFEQGVRTSVKSLENLKKGLDLDGAAKSLSKLDRAGKNFSLAGMASSVDLIASRFTNLGIVATTVIQNITNRAVDAGLRIASALTIDPLKQGFDEYEIKMNSIQTLLSNTSDKGTTLEDVNKALAELNEYSDKTIYNFAQMTDNAAKFAAAGIDLDSSILNVKGMANVAAGFGVNAEKMAGATYQMTQALGAGRVIWEDWKSLQQAGMGGVKLQKEMTAMADKMGIVRDKSKSFKDSLESGWLTAEVFTKVMGKMANDPALLEAATNVNTFTKMIDTMKEAMASGWAQSWENILGGAEESRLVWTGLSNAFAEVVGGSANARNAMLRFWSDNGGRKDLILGIANALTALGTVLAPIEQAFANAFPPITGDTLLYISKKFKELTEWFIVGETTTNRMQRTFQGFFAILDTIGMVLGTVIRLGTNLIKTFAPAGNLFLAITANIGDFLVALNNIFKTLGFFGKETTQAISDLWTNTFSTKTAETLTKISDRLKTFASNIELSEGFLTNVKNVITKVVAVLDVMADKFNGLKTDMVALSKIFMGTSDVATTYANASDTIADSNVKMEESTSGLVGFFVMLQGVFTQIKTALPRVIGGIGNVFSTLTDKISESMKGVTFEEVIHTIQSFITGALFLSIRKLVKVLSEGLPGVLEGATKALDAVTNSLKTFQNGVRAKMILNIAIALAILTASLYVLAKIDPNKMGVALGALTAMLVQLMGALGIFSKIMDGRQFITMFQLGIAMISMAIAISILATAMKKLADLDWNAVVKGLLVITVLMAELLVVSLILSRQGVALTGASVGLIGIALAIGLFTTALASAGLLPWDVLLKGLLAVSLALAGIITLAKMTSGTDLLTTAAGIAIIAGALHILTAAIAILGNMNMDTLKQGLLIIAITLTQIVVAMRLIPPGLFGSAAGVLAIAVALNVMASAIAIFGHMDIGTIKQGLISVAGLLIVLVTAMNFLKGTVGSAVALAIVAASLNLLIIPIAALGAMTLVTIGTGILAIAAALIVLGGTSAILVPFAPAMVSISGAVALLGLGLLAITTAIGVFAVAMLALVAAGASILAFIPTLGLIIQGVIKEINKAIPMLGDTLNLILKVLKNSLPDLFNLIRAIFDGLLALIVEYTPKLVASLLAMFITAVDELHKRSKDIAGAIVKLIDTVFVDIGGALLSKAANIGSDIASGLVNGIKNGYKKLFGAGSDAGDAVKEGLQDSLDSHSPSEETAKEGKNAVDGVVVGAKKGAGAASDLFFKMGENLSKAFGGGTKKGTPEAVDAAGKMGSEAGKKAGKKAKTAFELSMDWIEEEKYYKRLSLDAELEAYERMLKRYAAGSEEYKKLNREIYRVKNDIEAAAFKKSMDWIDEKKFYNDLSLQQELDAIDRVLARHSEASEEHKKLDREGFRIKQEQIKALADAREKENQNSFAWLADELFYGRLTTQGNIEGNQRIVDRISKVAKPTNEELESLKTALKNIHTLEKQARDETYELRKNAIDDDKYYKRIGLVEELKMLKDMQRKYGKTSEKRKEIDKEVFRVQEEILDANKTYTKELETIQKESNTKKLELEREYYEKTKEINTKLNDDISSLTKTYDEAVESRTNAIYNSYGLFDKVNKQGVVNGKALIVNLKTQIAELNKWREVLASLSGKGVDAELLKELSQMGPKSLFQIQALNKLSGQELDQYVKLWQQKYSEAKKQATGELVDLKGETTTKIEKLTLETEKKLEEHNKSWNAKMTTLVTETVESLTSLETSWTTKIGNVRTGTENEISTLTSRIKEIIQKPDWSILAGTIMNPITAGIKSKAVLMAQEVSNAVLLALRTADSILDKRKTTPLQEALLKTSNLLDGSGSPQLSPTQVLNLDSIKNRPTGISTTKSTSLAGTIFDPNSTLNKANGINQTPTKPTNSIWNEFTISNLTVREEADVRKVARELYQLQVAGSRG